VKAGAGGADGTQIKANASKHKTMSYLRHEEEAGNGAAGESTVGWLPPNAPSEEDKLHGAARRRDAGWVPTRRRGWRRSAGQAALEAEEKAATERSATGRRRTSASPKWQDERRRRRARSKALTASRKPS